jgi:hypothetical protein
VTAVLNSFVWLLAFHRWFRRSLRRDPRLAVANSRTGSGIMMGRQAKSVAEEFVSVSAQLSFGSFAFQGFL